MRRTVQAAPTSAVISHRMWTQALGGADIAARALRRNGVAYR
jgi:hypothetical protein